MHPFFFYQGSIFAHLSNFACSLGGRKVFVHIGMLNVCFRKILVNGPHVGMIWWRELLEKLSMSMVLW
jgi:hypothetical protein